MQIDLPEQIGTVAGDVGQPAFPDVFPCHAHGGRVDVIGTAYAGTQSGCADGENACARPDVQHPAPGLCVVLKQADHQTGCLMRPGSECHAGIHPDDQLAACRCIGLPCGADNNAVSDFQGLVVLLPVVRPVLLVDADQLKLSVQPVRRHAVAQECHIVRVTPARGHIHRNGCHGAVGVQNLLVNQVAVAGAQICFNVRVVLDHQVIADHAHQRGQRVQLLQRHGDADLRPRLDIAVILAYVVRVALRHILFAHHISFLGRLSPARASPAARERRHSAVFLLTPDLRITS